MIASSSLCSKFPLVISLILFAIRPSTPPLNTLALNPPSRLKHAHTFSGAIEPISSIIDLPAPRKLPNARSNIFGIAIGSTGALQKLIKFATCCASANIPLSLPNTLSSLVCSIKLFIDESRLLSASNNSDCIPGMFNNALILLLMHSCKLGIFKPLPPSTPHKISLSEKLYSAFATTRSASLPSAVVPLK